MTQEDKTLLLKDLCGRLPYGVIVKVTEEVPNTMEEIFVGMHKCQTIDINDLTSNNANFIVKPYLRPMSSMTEDETLEFVKTTIKTPDGYPMWTTDSYDWLNANHFDYRGLIEKELAIKVTKENNPYERF